MIRARILIILTMFIAGAALIAGRLIFLQIITGDEWAAEAEALASREKTIPWLRGSILDRNGKLIAFDEPVYLIDFEYQSFRTKNPLAQATHALLILEGPGEGDRARSLMSVAANPAGAVAAIGAATPARIAEVDPPAERDVLSGYIEKLFGLDTTENRPLRARYREALRRRDATPLRELFETEYSRIITKIETAVEQLRRLDEALGRTPGDSIIQLEEFRNDILADVEAAIAKSYETGTLTQTDDVSAERTHRRRRRETWVERFAEEAPYAAIELLSFRSSRYPGFSTGEGTARRYASPTLPWVVGSLRKPFPNELQQFRDARARLEDLLRQIEHSEEETAEIERLREQVANFNEDAESRIGGSGVERELESQLRGTRGYLYEVAGRRGGTADHVEYQPPVHGKNVYLTIDLSLQKTAEQILQSGAPSLGGVAVRGSCVVVDVHTGDVLAIAATPDFTREDLKDSRRYAELLRIDSDRTNPSHPLHHRGYRPWLPPTPGSSFKIVTAVAALEAGVITPETLHHCDGKIGMLHCDGVHRDINLREAIEGSCNCYFGWLGEKLGLANLDAQARRFGYSQKTGFDRLEVAGGFGIQSADVDMLRRCGVGYQIDCTPLQVARSYAVIANGGKLIKLRSVRAVGNEAVPVAPPQDLNISPEILNLIKTSLRDVVAGARGTARSSGLASLGVAGKTGTAEVDSRLDLNHAWFAGYAPYDAPEIAFAIYLEKVPLHGKDVTPLVRSLLESPAMAPYISKK